ncbi:iron-containing alcohol dehydrogenase [Cognatishimia sp.]|uniref:iron-containing alcohol dehydrogenase n=1 Tax=Cognatishimia sp. TaxID=2211648 RepID=UPI003512C89D|nr:iron-containing alcohol dehydrogenase [Cognatishimia sp.]
MSLIQYLSRIQFDFGAISLLAQEINALGFKRPLLITDKGIENSGILQRVLDAAAPHKPALYTGTTENPTEASLHECMALWAEHRCDGLIALGGGSPIDLTKAVALLASHGGKLEDYNVKTGGSAKIGKVVPQIAIPTAAGTGAEVGRACVMTLESGRKMVAVNLNMVADTIIADPELTLSLPANLTAATGIDALSHCVETFISPTINPPADAIALDGLARAAQWLPVAVQDGSNRQARWEMMMASLEGGMVLQKGLGAAHAMATPLGEHHHHHGTLIGILLPHVLAYNSDAVPARMEQMAQTVKTKRNLHDWTTDLVSSIGLPTTLSALGETGETYTEIAEKAKADHLTLTNPKPVEVEDYLNLLRGAL